MAWHISISDVLIFRAIEREIYKFEENMYKCN